MVMLFFLPVSVFAQKNLMHIEGITGVGAGFGMTKYSIVTNLSYGYYVKEKIMLSPSIEYERGSRGFTNFNTYSVKASSFYTVAKLGKRDFINLGGSFLGGYERLECDVMPLNDGKMYFGTGPVFLNELYITSSFSFNLQVSQEYFFRSNLRSWRFIGMASLHYYIF